MREIAGQLIKQGKFKQAIPNALFEIEMAEGFGLLTNKEKWGTDGLLERLMLLLLSANFDDAQKVGDSFLNLAMRIPDYIERVDKNTFLDNVKLNYATE